MASTTIDIKPDVKPEVEKLDLGDLEEDDDFEEFPADNIASKTEEEEDVKVWEDNWDDDNVEDDFSLQLMNELQNQGFTPASGNGKAKK